MAHAAVSKNTLRSLAYVPSAGSLATALAAARRRSACEIRVRSITGTADPGACRGGGSPRTTGSGADDYSLGTAGRRGGRLAAMDTASKASRTSAAVLVARTRAGPFEPTGRDARAGHGGDRRRGRGGSDRSGACVPSPRVVIEAPRVVMKLPARCNRSSTRCDRSSTLIEDPRSRDRIRVLAGAELAIALATQTRFSAARRASCDRLGRAYARGAAPPGTQAPGSGRQRLAGVGRNAEGLGQRAVARARRLPFRPSGKRSAGSGWRLVGVYESDSAGPAW